VAAKGQKRQIGRGDSETKARARNATRALLTALQLAISGQVHKRRGSADRIFACVLPPRCHISPTFCRPLSASLAHKTFFTLDLLSIFTMRAALTLLSLAASAFAVAVTQPNASQGWTIGSGQNTVSWSSVSTDRANFTILLVNQVRFYADFARRL
jgi:hypothetical protein